MDWYWPWTFLKKGSWNIKNYILVVSSFYKQIYNKNCRLVSVDFLNLSGFLYQLLVNPPGILAVAAGLNGNE